MERIAILLKKYIKGVPVTLRYKYRNFKDDFLHNISRPVLWLSDFPDIRSKYIPYYPNDLKAHLTTQFFDSKKDQFEADFKNKNLNEEQYQVFCNLFYRAIQVSHKEAVNLQEKFYMQQIECMVDQANFIEVPTEILKAFLGTPFHSHGLSVSLRPNNLTYIKAYSLKPYTDWLTFLNQSQTSFFKFNPNTRGTPKSNLKNFPLRKLDSNENKDCFIIAYQITPNLPLMLNLISSKTDNGFVNNLKSFLVQQIARYSHIYQGDLQQLGPSKNIITVRSSIPKLFVATLLGVSSLAGFLSNIFSSVLSLPLLFNDIISIILALLTLKLLTIDKIRNICDFLIFSNFQNKSFANLNIKNSVFGLKWPLSRYFLTENKRSMNHKISEISSPSLLKTDEVHIGLDRLPRTINTNTSTSFTDHTLLNLDINRKNFTATESSQNLKNIQKTHDIIANTENSIYETIFQLAKRQTYAKDLLFYTFTLLATNNNNNVFNLSTDSLKKIGLSEIKTIQYNGQRFISQASVERLIETWLSHPNSFNSHPSETYHEASAQSPSNIISSASTVAPRFEFDSTDILKPIFTSSSFQGDPISMKNDRNTAEPYDIISQNSALFGLLQTISVKITESVDDKNDTINDKDDKNAELTSNGDTVTYVRALSLAQSIKILSSFGLH